MKIGVVGGGAIGLLTAGYLSEHFPVTLYVRREKQKESLLSAGITIINGPETFKNIQVETSDQEWREDLIILTVKQPDIPDLLKEHPNAAVVGQALLFLQNGASHLELLKHLTYDHIFVGMVEHGALKTSDTCVVQKGFGQIKVGVERGNPNVLKDLFSYTPFPFTFVRDWQQALEEKLLVNAVINPLTSLFRVSNGELLNNPHYHHVMHSVFKEVITVLQPQDEQKVWHHLKKVCQNTAENRSSMLQDIEAQRKTEIDAIIGVILLRAQTKGIETPVLYFLYESIKGLEEIGGRDYD